MSDPDQLSDAAREAVEIAAAGRAIAISAISTWEVALLVDRGRLTLRMDVADWIAHSEALPYWTFIPVDNKIAFGSVALPPPFHPDPADRMIVATARSLNIPVVTKDQRIRSYPHVTTIW